MTTARIRFNRSGVHRCDSCGTLFPVTECYACDFSHECSDGYFDASELWDHDFEGDES